MSDSLTESRVNAVSFRIVLYTAAKSSIFAATTALNSVPVPQPPKAEEPKYLLGEWSPKEPSLFAVISRSDTDDGTFFVANFCRGNSSSASNHLFRHKTPDVYRRNARQLDVQHPSIACPLLFCEFADWLFRFTLKLELAVREIDLHPAAGSQVPFQDFCRQRVL